MRKILILLIAIQRTSKSVHYSASGDSFYSDHLLADRIYDGIEDFIDEIQENYFLGKEEDTPSQAGLLKSASEIIPPETKSMRNAFDGLDKLILSCIDAIETKVELEDLTAGDNDLLGRICSDLQKKHGFIWRRNKE